MKYQYLMIQRQFFSDSSVTYYKGTPNTGYVPVRKEGGHKKMIRTKHQSVVLERDVLSYQQLQDMMKMKTHYIIKFFTEEEWFLEQI